MALDITISLDDDQEAALERLKTAHNDRMSGRITASEYAQQFVNDWLGVEVRRYKDSQRRTLLTAYERATAEDKARVDAILEKTRS